MNIAYLVNQHPYPSCTFIRREIAGVEAQGHRVFRFSIRRPDTRIQDPADLQEAEKTRYILSVASSTRLLVGLGGQLLRHPLLLASAFLLALRIGRHSDRGLLVNMAYLTEACILHRWLRALEIEHVHAHFGTNPAAVAMFCRSLGGPAFSFTVHGPEEFDKPVAISLEHKIRRANFVVAVSNFGKSQLCRWCAYSEWSKIHVVRCGVDGSFLCGPYVPLPMEKRFVCVGRLCEQKGQLLLIEAVCLLVAQGLGFRLVLVGGGPLQGQVQSLIRERGIEKYVTITGWVSNEEIRRHIIEAQVMILPSFAEGLPVALMESMSLGRPVISTYVAGIPEFACP